MMLCLLKLILKEEINPIEKEKEKKYMQLARSLSLFPNWISQLTFFFSLNTTFSHSLLLPISLSEMEILSCFLQHFLLLHLKILWSRITTMRVIPPTGHHPHLFPKRNPLQTVVWEKWSLLALDQSNPLPSSSIYFNKVFEFK